MNIKAAYFINGVACVLIPMWVLNPSREGLTLGAAVACVWIIWRTRND